MSTSDAFVAANRFGYGARPGELARIVADPRGWLLAQIEHPQEMPAPLRTLPSSQAFLAEWMALHRDRKKKRAFYKSHGPKLYNEEARARTVAGIDSATPFRERLVRFWSNHFTVSAAVGKIRPIAGTLEREVIRSHVTGRFADMLIAVTQHPTMLLYLDNAASFGPDSTRGMRSERGLNENLGRELLELHTLGVDGGYTQADVIALAKILTGWRISGPRQGSAGRFYFDELAHEPGTKVLLGRRYSEDGVNEGETALRDIARHPSTARFIATELVRHFVADDPPPEAVKAIAQVFTKTDGDLLAVSRALVDLPQPWEEPLSKIKSPDDFVVSAWRLLGGATEKRDTLSLLRVLGQPPFSAPSPAGWPDTGAAWIAPEATVERIEIASLISKRREPIDARAAADDVLGPVLSKTSRIMIAGAESRREAVALLLAAPEFQRR